MKKMTIAAMICLVFFAGCEGGGKIAGGASGTATASAPSLHGDVTVTITVEKGKLVSVTAEGPDETPTVGGPVLLSIPAQMVQSNSFDVDTVSGATVTSQAIINAAKAAEAQIGN